MKKIVIILALAFVSTSLTAQWGGKKVKGNGSSITEKRNVANYDEVNIAGSFEVLLVAGTEGEISVEAEENLQKHIITEVKNGNLKIYTENGYNLSTGRNNPIVITVPFKDLEKVNMAGSGDVIGKDPITSQNFKCSLAGSGNMSLEIIANKIEASLAGSGDLNLKGNAETTYYKVAGSGDLDAANLKSKDIEASVAGSGDIRLNCDGGKLEAKVAGSGDIRYSGKPDKIDSKVVGSGSISN